MPFDKIKTEVEVTQEFEAKTYGPATLLRHLVGTVTTVQIGEKRGKKEKSLTKNAFCVPVDFYLQKIAEHGDDPTWIKDVDYNERYVAVSEKFLQGYYDQTDEFYESTYDESYSGADLVAALEVGNFERIVINRVNYDHNLYGLDGKRVQRLLRFDYINGRLKGRYYHLNPLQNYLEKHPQVAGLELIDVPWYNQDFPGEKAIEFKFRAKNQEEFDSIFDTKYGVARVVKVHEILGCDQFQKEEEE